MSYKVTKFEVVFKKQTIPVAVHTVVDGEETNYIVSIEDHENFEIRLGKDNQWKADKGAEVNEELLGLVIIQYEGSKSS